MSKTAIITGANKGIGLAVAKNLISKNYQVILACRDITKGKMAQEFLGSNTKFLELDLSRPSSISQFVKQINSDYSEIDVLYNNAGLIYRDFQLGNIIRPVLIELVEKTEETAAFHVLRGNSGVVLYCENSKRRMRYHIDEGEITPLNVGSSGKVLEAFVSPETSQSKIIQEQGYYISLGERDPDIAGISIPVLGRENELIGVISLSGLVNRFTEDNIKNYLKVLLTISKKVCKAFGN